jgi:hypothetical protein
VHLSRRTIPLAVGKWDCAKANYTKKMKVSIKSKHMRDKVVTHFESFIQTESLLEIRMTTRHAETSMVPASYLKNQRESRFVFSIEFLSEKEEWSLRLPFHLFLRG